ncbi:MAG: AAA domain-containing protein [Planctomycetota bacterium]
MPLLHLEPLSRGITKSNLLAFLHTVGGLDRQRVGRIELRGREATVEIPDGWQSRLVKALDGEMLGGRRVQVWADISTDSGSGGEDHFERLARLLDMESRAEAQEAAERGRRLSPADAERTGTSLVDLVITDEDAGLGGRYLLQLAKRNRSLLPWTRLGVGSPVVLSPDTNKATTRYRGVVYERAEGSLRVALGSMADDLAEHETWRLDLSTDEVAVARQRSALQRARAASGDRRAELREVLLGGRQPEFGAEQDEPALDPGLNDTQQEAVRFALSARDVALIHGPPGPGKTTTVVELIRRAIRRGQKVLACAPSNLAVDNIFERLLVAKERAVRLGHPARVMPDLRAHTLDLLVDDHADVRLARKLVKEAMSLFRQAGRYTRAKPAPEARQEARREAKNLLADARRLEAQAVEHILDTADVLCATTTGLDSELLGTRRFDLAVIDEACQSTEPGCWIPLLWCDRVVLAGDHCQLPPTVVSREAAAEGFGVSLFERLVALYGPQISRRLTVQYRMHQAIMDFSSLEFYEAELEADAVVREHLLVGLEGVTPTPLTQSAVEFIDTAGAGFDEEVEPDGQSRLNRQEATLVCRKVQELLDSGVAADDIAVITPYAAQVRLLREQLPVAGLEIDSVDGFQGREKEAVVMSLVRSNPKGEIGFLADVRRMNVAMTRARRKLLVVGDSATVSGHPFYRRMVEYFEGLGAYRTVWEGEGAV